RWHRIPGSPAGRRDPIVLPSRRNRGRLRCAHDRAPLPAGVLPGGGARADRELPWVLVRRCVRRLRYVGRPTVRGRAAPSVRRATDSRSDRIGVEADPALVVASPPQTSHLPSTAARSDRLVVIVNYDEAVTTSDAMSAAIMNIGSGVIQFNNLDLVAAFATPAEITAIHALPGVQGVYANKQLTWETAMLHESVPSIRADAVQASGITGKGIGIAILDSGIDGLYNPDLHYPDKTVQNVKVLFNLTDLFTFKGSINKTAKAADLFVENLPNSETSVGHGTHVAGIAAGLGTASAGYYTGVAPGAKLVGISTGDILFIFWALAGFDYILDHQKAYNIMVVNNSWGTSGPFDPKDPINKATKKVHDMGITVVFAAGNDGPDQNTLNPYSVAPWVIGV